MTARYQLPSRRMHHVIEFGFHGERYRAGFCFFENGALAEIFLTAARASSDADISAKDSAILASIALQHGIPVRTLRHALLESDNGTAAGALGHALDLIDAGSYAS